jgi:hypothetical protein
MFAVGHAVPLAAGTGFIVTETIRPVNVIGALENEQDDRAKVNSLFGSLNS